MTKDEPVVPPFLTGARVYLRALTEADCDGPYVRWFNDPDVCRFNGHHRFPYTRQAAQAYVRSLAGSHDQLVLAIALRDEHRHIGNLALEQIDPIARSAEFAILMGETECWGKGYATEAARLLLDHGFGELNLYRVGCGTSEANVAMQRLAGALAMREEGRRRHAMFKGGAFLDIIEYGVLKPEYEVARGGW